MKSKNLTIALKPGNIKSSSNPVYCQIGGVVKKVKLSKDFKNAGTIAKGKGRPRKDFDSFVTIKVTISKTGEIKHYYSKGDEWIFFEPSIKLIK